MSEEKICHKCIHFNLWEGNTWCIEEEGLSWNNAPYCDKYEEMEIIEEWRDGE